MTNSILILRKFHFDSFSWVGSTWVTLEDTLGLKQILTMGRMWRLVDARHITPDVASSARHITFSVVASARNITLNPKPCLLWPLLWLAARISIVWAANSHKWRCGHSHQERRWGRRKQEMTNRHRNTSCLGTEKQGGRCWWQTVVRGGLHEGSHDLSSYQRSRKKLLLLFMDHLLIILALPNHPPSSSPPHHLSSASSSS